MSIGTMAIHPDTHRMYAEAYIASGAAMVRLQEHQDVLAARFVDGRDRVVVRWGESVYPEPQYVPPAYNGAASSVPFTFDPPKPRKLSYRERQGARRARALNNGLPNGA